MILIAGRIISTWDYELARNMADWLEHVERIEAGWKFICSLSPAKSNPLRIVTRKIKPLIVRFLPIWRRGRWKAKA